MTDRDKTGGPDAVASGMDPEIPIPIDEIRDRRRTEAVRSALPYSPSWEAWLERSGELAPDFSTLVPRPALWTATDGLAGAGEWPARADDIRARLDHWVLGTVPPSVPDDIDVDVMDERRRAGTVDRALEVSVADGSARVRARLLMPATGSAFPVVLMSAAQGWWAAAALRRGWAACLVRACDGADGSEALAGAFPLADWGRLARRAWAYARAVDALLEMPEIDPLAIVVAGHGPDGKVALAAAAAEPRIAAVAACSSGVLGAIPARLCAERHFGPGIEGITRHQPDWFHPRLRFFAGREHLLPTDSHELLAPRPVLLSTGVHDPDESTWAAERAIDAVRPVYELLGSPAGRLALRWREGGSECSPETWEGVLDWADYAVGRTGTGIEATRRLHLRDGITWPAPVAPNRAPLDAPDLELAIERALGIEPPVTPDAFAEPQPEPAHTAALLGRADHPAQLLRSTVRTADGVAVEVHLPARAGAFPLVLWLGPLARATGYAETSDAPPVWEMLAADGWAVACFDPLGTGSRLEEEAGFRRRHPGWSPLGRMVHDARAAIAAARSLPEVEPRAPWVAGYGSGAVVALHVAAIDPAIAGLALVAPTAANVPLLAAEPEYGTADLLGALGRRPALIVSPETDPEADAGDMGAAVRAAAGEHALVEHVVLRDHNRLSGDARELLRMWLREAVSRTSAVA